MFFVLDENKNLVEAFDKEGFLALLEQVIEEGSLENIDEDSAVASKLRSIINGTAHHIEFVTQAQYNQLENDGELVPNTYYFITDDETAEDFADAIEALQTLTNRLSESIAKITNAMECDAESFSVVRVVENFETTLNTKLENGLYIFYVYDPIAMISPSPYPINPAQRIPTVTMWVDETIKLCSPEFMFSYKTDDNFYTETNRFLVTDGYVDISGGDHFKQNLIIACKKISL